MTQLSLLKITMAIINCHKIYRTSYNFGALGIFFYNELMIKITFVELFQCNTNLINPVCSLLINENILSDRHNVYILALTYEYVVGFQGIFKKKWLRPQISRKNCQKQIVKQERSNSDHNAIYFNMTESVPQMTSLRFKYFNVSVESVHNY